MAKKDISKEAKPLKSNLQTINKKREKLAHEQKSNLYIGMEDRVENGKRE